MKPQRIQRKRTKGWKMPANTVYVGRPTKWGNPFVIDEKGEITNREIAVSSFRHIIRDIGSWCSVPVKKWPKGKIPGEQMWVTTDDVRRELRGKDLACWCPLDQPCHADALLEIANS